MNNNRKEYTEVLEILDYLEEDEYKKIPPEVIEAFEKNLDENYEYEFDDEQSIASQILPGTKAILFNLFRDYLSTPEQKEKIIKMQAEERKRNELKKQQSYSTNIFENRTKSNQTKEVNEEVEITVYKESLFDKIAEWMKQLFSKIKHSN